MEKRLLTVAEAAQYLSIHHKTLRDLIYRHELPCVRIGRAVRIDIKALEAYVQRHVDDQAA